MDVKNRAAKNMNPEEMTTSSLQPPSMQGPIAGHQFRASADMSSPKTAPMAEHSIRPLSELIYEPKPSQQADVVDRAADQWIAQIDQCEITLEEMASATTDQDFKAELTAIEEWFRVLSEAERTASLYALLQQTSKVQMLFFLQTLQEMLKKQSVQTTESLSSSSARDGISDKAARLSVRSNETPPRDGTGEDLGAMRQAPAANSKSTCGLDSSTISAMFPDAANAIAKKKAELTHHIGMSPASASTGLSSNEQPNASSPIIPDTVKTSADNDLQTSALLHSLGQAPKVAEAQRTASQIPATRYINAITGNPLSARRWNSPMDNNFNSSTSQLSDRNMNLPLLSPYNLGNNSWASLSSTPLQPHFQHTNSGLQTELIANANVMKLAALSTVNNRIALDDVRKYQRRARSSDKQAREERSMAPANGSPRTPSFKDSEKGGLASQTRPDDMRSPLRTSGFNAAEQKAQTDSSAEMRFLQSMDADPGGQTSDLPHVRGRSPQLSRISSKTDEVIDFRILQDVPNWLRSLRLHKYTTNFDGLNWKDIIEMDDAALTARGINALGARRKLLKVSPIFCVMMIIDVMQVFDQTREALQKDALAG